MFHEDDKLTGVEAVLALLRPSAGGIDRDRLAFAMGEAWGRRTARRPTWKRLAWPSTALAMTGLAASLLLVLIARPTAPELAQEPVLPQPVSKSLAPEAGSEPILAESWLLKVLVPSIGDGLNRAGYMRLRHEILACRSEADLPSVEDRSTLPAVNPVKESDEADLQKTIPPFRWKLFLGGET